MSREVEDPWHSQVGGSLPVCGLNYSHLMDFLLRKTLWLWAALLKPWHGSLMLPRVRTVSTVVAVLACLALPVAHAEEASKVKVPATQNPYIPAAANLYEHGKYEETWSMLEKALDWKSNGPQEVIWLKSMRGVLQVELGRGEPLESFKEALALDRQAQLPVEGNRRLRRIFEQARNTLGLPADKELLAKELEGSTGARAAVSPPPARRYGLSVGVRGEMDVLAFASSLPLTSDSTLPVAPAVSLGYTREKLGGVVTVVVQPSPALRAEGQFHPLTLGWVRPYARVGATTFFGELNLEGQPTFLGGVGGRVGLGLDVQWNSRMYAFADVSYEHFFAGGERYRPQAVLFSMGVGLFP